MRPVRVIPHRMRHAIRFRADLLRDLPERLDRIETLMLETHEQHVERSKRRWQNALPDPDLTFARRLSGDAFIAKAIEHGAFGPGKSVVEVGPGYGRLLDAALKAGVKFGSWHGIDLSPHNVRFLEERFPEQSWVCADAESVELAVRPDTVLSSLTLKHVYPSFERALANVARGASKVVVDLIEGERRYFERADTYIRWYRRDEVEEIFGRAGFRVVFDRVEHDPDHVRLLAVGYPG
jgi:SAM-dependent methyltransferase